MAKSEDLRRNIEQHKPKNLHSKSDDKAIHKAMCECIEYLNKRFKEYLNGHYLRFNKSISFRTMMQIIRTQGLRKEFDTVFERREIKPDGGIIALHKKDDDRYIKIVLISEVKRQGTNKERMAEGKPKQAQGNAIERLGKNLIGIKAMMNHERITPFICFGWGCDFVQDYKDDFVMSKLCMMNEFYKLNKVYVFKRDGDSNRNHYSPVSMFFREKEWTSEEMFKILKEIAEDSVRYYLH